MADDLYALLGVARDASAEEIKRAYRRKARDSHPDTGGDEEEFKRLSHAYEVLSDSQRRARYDRFGDESRGGTGDPFGFSSAGFGGINDVIDAFFGSAFGGGGGGTRRRSHGRDVLVAVELTLEEVLTGARRDVEIEAAVSCDACGGSGSADGASAGRCRTCGGAGQVQQVVRTAFGQMATASGCPTCHGSGRAVSDPCVTCGGEGRRLERRTVTVEIPAGVEHGDRLRIAGGGEAGRHGATGGDLYVEIHVAAHEVFERDARDVLAEIVVPMTHAALGGTLHVPTLDGDEREVSVPAGTQPGDVLTIRRGGLPTKGGGRRGDLRLVVTVEIPRDLDDRQRALLSELAEQRDEAQDLAGSSVFARLRGAFPR